MEIENYSACTRTGQKMKSPTHQHSMLSDESSELILPNLVPTGDAQSHQVSSPPKLVATCKPYEGRSPGRKRTARKSAVCLREQVTYVEMLDDSVGKSKEGSDINSSGSIMTVDSLMEPNISSKHPALQNHAQRSTATTMQSNRTTATVQIKPIAQTIATQANQASLTQPKSVISVESRPVQLSPSLQTLPKSTIQPKHVEAPKSNSNTDQSTISMGLSILAEASHQRSVLDSDVSMQDRLLSSTPIDPAHRPTIVPHRPPLVSRENKKGTAVTKGVNSNTHASVRRERNLQKSAKLKHHDRVKSAPAHPVDKLRKHAKTNSSRPSGDNKKSTAIRNAGGGIRKVSTSPIEQKGAIGNVRCFRTSPLAAFRRKSTGGGGSATAARRFRHRHCSSTSSQDEAKMGSRITEKHAKSVKTKLLSHFKEKRLSVPASTKDAPSVSNVHVEHSRQIENEKKNKKEQANKESEKENRGIQFHGNEISQKSHKAKQFQQNQHENVGYAKHEEALSNENPHEQNSNRQLQTRQDAGQMLAHNVKTNHKPGHSSKNNKNSNTPYPFKIMQEDRTSLTHDQIKQSQLVTPASCHTKSQTGKPGMTYETPKSIMGHLPDLPRHIEFPQDVNSPQDIFAMSAFVGQTPDAQGTKAGTNGSMATSLKRQLLLRHQMSQQDEQVPDDDVTSGKSNMAAVAGNILAHTDSTDDQQKEMEVSQNGGIKDKHEDLIKGNTDQSMVTISLEDHNLISYLMHNNSKVPNVNQELSMTAEMHRIAIKPSTTIQSKSDDVSKIKDMTSQSHELVVPQIVVSTDVPDASSFLSPDPSARDTSDQPSSDHSAKKPKRRRSKSKTPKDKRRAASPGRAASVNETEDVQENERIVLKLKRDQEHVASYKCVTAHTSGAGHNTQAQILWKDPLPAPGFKSNQDKNDTNAASQPHLPPAHSKMHWTQPPSFFRLDHHSAIPVPRSGSNMEHKPCMALDLTCPKTDKESKVSDAGLGTDAALVQAYQCFRRGTELQFTALQTLTGCIEKQAEELRDIRDQLRAQARQRENSEHLLNHLSNCLQHAAAL